MTRSQWVQLLAILVVALALRLFGLGVRDVFWEDEVALWRYAVTGEPFLLPDEAPLYAWLQFFWMTLTREPTVVTMRLLSIGLGWLDVIGAFALGRIVAGPRVGLLTAALVALSPVAIYLSHEVRPYTLFILTSTALIGSWRIAWERDRPLHWFLYGVALAVSSMTHLLTSQICAAIAITAIIALWIERNRAGGGGRFVRFALVSAGFGGLGISWLFSRSTPPWAPGGAYAEGISEFALRFTQSLAGVPDDLRLLALGSLLLCVSGLGFLARRRPLDAILFGAVIIVGGLLTFSTLEYASDWGWWGWQKYLSHLLIPFALLIAVGTDGISSYIASRMSGAKSPLFRIAFLVFPVLLLVPGLSIWLGDPNRHPAAANAHGYARYFAQRGDAVDGLLFLEAEIIQVPGMGEGVVRRRDTISLVRHDRLPTYALGLPGMQGVRELPGRLRVARTPEVVKLERLPADGAYVVFPPSVACPALERPPYQQIQRSIEVHASTWGRTCEIEFQRRATRKR